ncbi:dolichyl-phosphate mannose synthase [Alteribacter lacisalsi]|uniref:Glucosyl-3-phosphoglycerate synthase n=1 Tax=Alteribacter lacisalsi TaxID=2045244 RepID=A0A2W0H9N5_9BACI|nr:glycosyltransferase family 2 protein [Alteribacter lacisalsi]PYZ98564.1 dolichyl-phosphate mannose synthase [Alteribacter lacisalsi]
MKVDVVMPAYNEGQRIAATLGSLRNEPWINSIYVIDDGSTDDTYTRASGIADYVFRFPVNQGKAAAAITGLRQTKHDYVMLLDADLEETAVEAVKLLNPLRRGEADIVLASFSNTVEKKGFGFMKRRASRVISSHFGIYLSSPLSGQRVFHRKWLSVLSEDVGHCRYGFEMACNFDLLSHGAVIKEVDTGMKHNGYGKTVAGFLHRSRQWYEMERVLWQRTSGSLQ